ncbi:MAG TPA: hypothetical protein VFP37_10805 [Steroidobacteraceae bacterium]|nr:hypothetical protein [Steroidobacteraceae bacterium]
MKKYVSFAVLWAACALPAIGCEKPSSPTTIPDGKTASKEEMLAAKKAIDAFKLAMEEYMGCERSNTKIESAHAELEKVADRFNEQVRAFKAKG